MRKGFIRKPIVNEAGITVIGRKPSRVTPERREAYKKYKLGANYKAPKK